MAPVIKTRGLSRNYAVGTHEPDVAARAERRIVLRDGVISSDSPTTRGVMV